MRSIIISVVVVAACLQLAAACNNPMGNLNYRLGEGPTAHVKRLQKYSTRWQDLNAVDFLAPAGTPVVAVVNGTICDPAKNSTCVWGKTAAEMKDRFSLNSFYLLGDDGQTYYYTHLQSIVAKPGEKVKAGQLVAYVGAYNGKNAHLHLAIPSPGNACDILKCLPADTRGCR